MEEGKGPLPDFGCPFLCVLGRQSEVGPLGTQPLTSGPAFMTCCLSGLRQWSCGSQNLPGCLRWKAWMSLSRDGMLVESARFNYRKNSQIWCLIM